MTWPGEVQTWQVRPWCLVVSEELLRSGEADLHEALETRKQSELAEMEGDVSGWVSGGMEQNPAVPHWEVMET